jgi:replicative DNA helicase
MRSNASLRHEEIAGHISGVGGPAALEAEKRLIGMVLRDPEVAELTDGLTAPHFIVPLHGRIWAALEASRATGVAADTAVIDARFMADQAYQGAGGLAWLMDLHDLAPAPYHATAYAAEIREAATLRALIQLAEDAQAEMSKGEATSAEMLDLLRRRSEDIERDAVDADATLIPAPAVARRTILAMEEMARSGKPRGLMTGLRCIDRRMNGLKPGSLIIVGGRPGMCKTGLLRAAMHGAAVRNPERDFLLFSAEMGPDEIMQRELSALTHEYGDGVPYNAMESGTLTPFDFTNIGTAEGHVPPNFIFDERASSVSTADIRRKVWAWNRKRRVGAVGIDYLQLLIRPQAKGRNEASVVGDMTRALKVMAQQAGICVILLSQLSRQVENREDKRPQLSDLRESGAIEQDADAVLFPFREHYYLVKAEPKPDPPGVSGKHLEWEMRCEDARRHLEVICAKQRGGPEGADRQRYFAEYDYIEDEPYEAR